MKTIWKFEIFVDQCEVSAMMPDGAWVMSVGTQKPGWICIWAIVDPARQAKGELSERKFRVYGTGMELMRRDGISDFIGTVIDGEFVWHVFGDK